jgi:hypothetical protein
LTRHVLLQDKYDLSIVYTDVLKKTALQYGPNSPEVMRALIDLDDVFQVIILNNDDIHKLMS